MLTQRHNFRPESTTLHLEWCSHDTKEAKQYYYSVVCNLMGNDLVKPMSILYCTSQISSYPVFNISISDGINLGAASCMTRIQKDFLSTSIVGGFLLLSCAQLNEFLFIYGGSGMCWLLCYLCHYLTYLLVLVWLCGYICQQTKKRKDGTSYFLVFYTTDVAILCKNIIHMTIVHI